MNTTTRGRRQGEGAKERAVVGSCAAKLARSLHSGYATKSYNGRNVGRARLFACVVFLLVATALWALSDPKPRSGEPRTAFEGANSCITSHEVRRVKGKSPSRCTITCHVCLGSTFLTYREGTGEEQEVRGEQASCSGKGKSDTKCQKCQKEERAADEFLHWAGGLIFRRHYRQGTTTSRTDNSQHILRLWLAGCCLCSQVSWSKLLICLSRLLLKITCCRQEEINNEFMLHLFVCLNVGVFCEE